MGRKATNVTTAQHLSNLSTAFDEILRSVHVWTVAQGPPQ